MEQEQPLAKNEPKMLHNMDYDFDIWYKTNDPVFSEISKNSSHTAISNKIRN